ncbi:MAG: hypothetical protein CMD26_00885 [Flavobacteriales bacterium]|nr:hypothetical protein [Flavobacteriales bacterium]
MPMTYKNTFLIYILSLSSLCAQNEIDALRYSLFGNYNTAGISALGGAGGLLSHSYNPASLAFFKGNQLLSISLGNTNENTESNYLGNQEIIEKIRPEPFLQNFGYVTQLNQIDNTLEWSPLNIAISYNRKQNFNRRHNIDGYNEQSSIIDQFLENAQGIVPQELYTSEWLAYETYLIDPIYNHDPISGDTIFTGEYSSSAITGQNQNKRLSESGYVNEIEIALSKSYKDFIFLGASIGFTEIQFKQNILYIENEFDQKSGIQYFEFNEERIQGGSGINFKIGAVIKPTSFMRIGYAYHSKTYNELTDLYRRSMITESQAMGYQTQFWDEEYDFELLTPSKSIASLALINSFNRIRVLATFDYEMINYASSQLTSTYPLGHQYYYSFSQENNNIENYYTKTSNKKAGLYLSFNNISIRGGYAIMGSPFKSNDLNNWSQEYVSGGIGYKINNYSFDIGLVQSMESQNEIIYYTSTDDQSTTINRDNNTIILTCSYKF